MKKINNDNLVILVSVEFKTINNKYNQNTSLAELYNLVESAGYQVVGELSQSRSTPDPSLFIGAGKVEELKQLAKNFKVCTVIFDHDLSPIQQKNLEEKLELTVIDRTELILKIFSQRAHTKEGKLQVELARLNYLLPRLIGKGKQMSRLGGGIGTRGPGEKQLEVDRRTIKNRIADLNKEIEAIKKHRTIQRNRRKKILVPVISLVGYTNAGKSTLLNTLTGSEVYVKNQLFATLDPVSRKTKLPSGQEVIFTDTVGFIQNLPTQLIAAFRATLEEIKEADLLVHVVDVSNENYLEQVESVYKVLKQIGVEKSLFITALNKADLVPHYLIERAKRQLPNSVPISAKKQVGLDELLLKIEDCLSARSSKIEVMIPYNKIDLLHLFYNYGIIEHLEYKNDGVFILGTLRNKEIGYLNKSLSNL
ncbi:MAG TPA: GTPase HflX [Clostridia bacterium]|nr:GTPase HflX [Clostridia bacterium]